MNGQHVSEAILQWLLCQRIISHTLTRTCGATLAICPGAFQCPRLYIWCAPTSTQRGIAACSTEWTPRTECSGAFHCPHCWSRSAPTVTWSSDGRGGPRGCTRTRNTRSTTRPGAFRRPWFGSLSAPTFTQCVLTLRLKASGADGLGKLAWWTLLLGDTLITWTTYASHKREGRCNSSSYFVVRAQWR